MLTVSAHQVQSKILSFCFPFQVSQLGIEELLVKLAHVLYLSS